MIDNNENITIAIMMQENEIDETSEIGESPLPAEDVYFNECLDRLYEQLNSKNKTIKKDKIQLPAPNLAQVGKIRTVWENFEAMANKLNRQPEHLREFFATELAMECSLSQKDEGPVKLVIKGKGRLQKSGILKILYSYIDTYVQCNVCHEMDTELIKKQRELFVFCKKCLSEHCCQV